MPDFLARKGRLVTNERRPVADSAHTTTYDLRLRSDTGLEARARLRVPNRGRHPGVLLAVGLHTGAKALELIGDYDDLVVMAMEYDRAATFDVRTLAALWRLRTVSLAAVPQQLLGLDALAAEPAVDLARLNVVGVSYGAYIALPAAVLEPRVSRLILAQGGAEIGATIAGNTVAWHLGLPAWWAGRLAEMLYAPFRPERWIGRLAPRPVTFIASRQDRTLPAASIERVFARAGEPKELLWRDLPHVGPDAAQSVAALAGAVVAELRKPR
jgi:hypothetical protein